MENWGRESCQVLLFYSLSQPKGAGNEGRVQGVWTQIMERAGYLCHAREEQRSFREHGHGLGRKWRSGDKELSRVRAEMVMTEDGLSA